MKKSISYIYPLFVLYTYLFSTVCQAESCGRDVTWCMNLDFSKLPQSIIDSIFGLNQPLPYVVSTTFPPQATATATTNFAPLPTSRDSIIVSPHRGHNAEKNWLHIKKDIHITYYFHDKKGEKTRSRNRKYDPDPSSINVSINSTGQVRIDFLRKIETKNESLNFYYLTIPVTICTDAKCSKTLEKETLEIHLSCNEKSSDSNLLSRTSSIKFTSGDGSPCRITGKNENGDSEVVAVSRKDLMKKISTSFKTSSSFPEEIDKLPAIPMLNEEWIKNPTFEFPLKEEGKSYFPVGHGIYTYTDDATKDKIISSRLEYKAQNKTITKINITYKGGSCTGYEDDDLSFHFKDSELTKIESQGRNVARYINGDIHEFSYPSYVHKKGYYYVYFRSWHKLTESIWPNLTKPLTQAQKNTASCLHTFGKRLRQNVEHIIRINAKQGKNTDRE